MDRRSSIQLLQRENELFHSSRRHLRICSYSHFIHSDRMREKVNNAHTLTHTSRVREKWSIRKSELGKSDMME